MPFEEAVVERELADELSLQAHEVKLYLRILKEGSLPASSRSPEVHKLLERGMVIVSGDNSRFIPVHPRLAIANYYRSWRELRIKEMNDKRMRVDKLILRLIPVYEQMTEKRLESERVGNET